MKIKFRVWDAAEDEFSSLKDYLDSAQWFSWINPKKIPKSLSIQQFTGLLDKNKKEIFEGDLVNFTIPKITHGPDEELGIEEEVYWDKELASWAFNRKIGYTMGDGIDVTSLEVVGNIFDA